MSGSYLQIFIFFLSNGVIAKVVFRDRYILFEGQTFKMFGQICKISPVAMELSVSVSVCVPVYLYQSLALITP